MVDVEVVIPLQNSFRVPGTYCTYATASSALHLLRCTGNGPINSIDYNSFTRRHSFWTTQNELNVYKRLDQGGPDVSGLLCMDIDAGDLERSPQISVQEGQGEGSFVGGHQVLGSSRRPSDTGELISHDNQKDKDSGLVRLFHGYYPSKH